jgi:hypothetical protein
MKLPLLTSAAAMAVLTGTTMAVASAEVTSDGISFHQQAVDAIEVFKEGDEEGSKKEMESSEGSKDLSSNEYEEKDPSFSNSESSYDTSGLSSVSSSFSDDLRSHKYSKGDVVIMESMCDPDDTKPEHFDICEDIWMTMCNPDDEDEVDDELCDWLGFTSDVAWVADENFEYGMVYERLENDDKKSSSRSKREESTQNRYKSNSLQFFEGMCDPDGMIKPEHEDICDDIWITMCNPDDEIEVDDEYCDWLGFTADVEWYDVEEDFDYETEKFYEAYDAEVGARKNLRGGNKNHNH